MQIDDTGKAQRSDKLMQFSYVAQVVAGMA
jgi:hypothetical protein